MQRFIKYSRLFIILTLKYTYSSVTMGAGNNDLCGNDRYDNPGLHNFYSSSFVYYSTILSPVQVLARDKSLKEASLEGKFHLIVFLHVFNTKKHLQLLQEIVSVLFSIYFSKVTLRIDNLFCTFLFLCLEGTQITPGWFFIIFLQCEFVA